MFNFLGKNYSVGIDFGTTSIKIVELEHKNGSTYLNNYGWIKLPTKNKKGDFEIRNKESEDDDLIKILNILQKKMALKNSSAHIAMGGYMGLSVLININNSTEDDLDEIIKMEASKYIPISLEEVYLSSDIVARETIDNKDNTKGADFFSKNKKENLEVLLVAAPKEDVHKYEKIVESSGLKVESFELDIFSLIRSLVGDDLGKFLIVDIGGKITNIIFVEKGIIRVNRNINIGGDEITKNIATNLNVTIERADEFKSENNYLKSQDRSMVLPVISIIAKEVKRIVDVNLSGAEKIFTGKIIITGGSSKISGIEEMFSQILGMPVSLGNSWSNILIENDTIKEMSETLEPIFAVATGLAMKGMVKKK